MKKILALILFMMFALNAQVLAEETEEVTAESIMQNIQEYLGLPVEFDEEWIPAYEIDKTDNFYVALLYNSENSAIVQVYVGKHEADPDREYDNLLGFAVKDKREKGTEVFSDDLPVTNNNGKVFYFYDETGEKLISSFSANFENGYIEFVTEYDKSEVTDEKLKEATENVTSFAVSLTMADLKVHPEENE